MVVEVGECRDNDRRISLQCEASNKGRSQFSNTSVPRAAKRVYYSTVSKIKMQIPVYRSPTARIGEATTAPWFDRHCLKLLQSSRPNQCQNLRMAGRRSSH